MNLNITLQSGLICYRLPDLKKPTNGKKLFHNYEVKIHLFFLSCIDFLNKLACNTLVLSIFYKNIVILIKYYLNDFVFENI